MELIEGIRSRRSIRRFTSEPLSHELIRAIVADAAYAPGWKNNQIVRYTYTDDRNIIDKIAEDMVLGFDFNRRSLASCTGVMVLSYLTGKTGFESDGRPTTSKGAEFEMFDAGCAAEAFCLAAHARGVGTVITGIFDEEKAVEFFGLKGQKIGCLIYMGYPAENPEPRPRLSADELLSFK